MMCVLAMVAQFANVNGSRDFSSTDSSRDTGTRERVKQTMSRRLSHAVGGVEPIVSGVLEFCGTHPEHQCQLFKARRLHCDFIVPTPSGMLSLAELCPCSCGKCGCSAASPSSPPLPLAPFDPQTGDIVLYTTISGTTKSTFTATIRSITVGVDGKTYNIEYEDEDAWGAWVSRPTGILHTDGTIALSAAPSSVALASPSPEPVEGAEPESELESPEPNVTQIECELAPAECGGSALPPPPPPSPPPSPPIASPSSPIAPSSGTRDDMDKGKGVTKADDVGLTVGLTVLATVVVAAILVAVALLYCRRKKQPHTHVNGRTVSAHPPPMMLTPQLPRT